MLKRATTIMSLLLGLTISSSGQSWTTNLKPGSVEAKALAFFEQIEERSFDDHLKRVRLPKVSEDHKSEVLARIEKNEGSGMSDGMKGKLSALDPILRYHERVSIIEVILIRAREAFVRVQGRAVLLISEPALNLLSAPELQAVVAHELGHEYFWVEFMEARRRKNYELMREIELRCDGIAVIAMLRLKLDPAKLDSALSRIRMFNARIALIDPLYHPQPDGRSRFIQAISELTKRRDANLAIVDWPPDAPSRPQK